mgnify:CR=1 FL=1
MEDISPSEQEVLLTHFDWNLQRLDEVLKKEKSDYFKGAALQRFGHTYDIALKMIRSVAQSKSIPCGMDERCFETAVQNGWMEKQPDWTEIVADYKRINQKPQQDTENVYSKLAAYHKAFHYLFARLKEMVAH